MRESGRMLKTSVGYDVDVVGGGSGDVTDAEGVNLHVIGVVGVVNAYTICVFNANVIVVVVNTDVLGAVADAAGVVNADAIGALSDVLVVVAVFCKCCQ